MVGEVTIKVDSTRAIAKLNRIPVSVRNALRRVIPNLTKQLGALVNAKLDSKLKTRTNLDVKQEMHENAQSITGVVSLVWNGDPTSKLVPTYLEYGTRPHEIAAVNANALAFFWERIGENVMFKRVQHPGFPGFYFLRDSLAESRDEITSQITAAVKQGAREA
jgi:hypothetical protein